MVYAARPLGVLRILVESELDLDLERLLVAAGKGYPPPVVESARPVTESPSPTPAVEVHAPPNNPEYPGLANGDTPTRVLEFLLDRLRTYFADQEIPATVFAAVHARRPTRPLDFAKRIHAVNAFRRLPEAASLAAANKRIGNILRQAGLASTADGTAAHVPAAERQAAANERTGEIASSVANPTAAHVDEALLSTEAERDLHARLVALGSEVQEKLAAGDYAGAMQLLAALRDDVDTFFDSVLVMAEDEAVRANRLTLLRNIHELFLETADISLLQDW